jgi:2-methylcitrate dehydratase PrpD
MSAVDFVHDLRFADLPVDVVAQAKRCLLDLTGVAAAGLGTDLSRICRGFAIRQMGAQEHGSRIIFDGRIASPAGAAYAGASTIDAFDAHDGHALTKGHAGVAVLPSLLSVADAEGGIDGPEFLSSLVLGYEIATRAGIALHASVGDYHTSGSWNALGCAAIVARNLGLGGGATRHAFGIAEYHGPRSQMMRCIDHPTMLKDGSGWGAFAGVSAGYLAAVGFTGAPAVTIEAAERAGLWRDLGERWRIRELYFKSYPICRWADPALEATRDLVRRHRIEKDRIACVRVETFAQAVRLGSRAPTTTEEAQYALCFPLAAFLVRGQLGASDVTAESLHDAQIRAMAERVVLRERAEFSRRFPAERLAVVTIEQDDGAIVVSEPTLARGDPTTPMTDDELLSKFRQLTAGLPPERQAGIEHAVQHLDTRTSASTELLDAVLNSAAAALRDIRKA